MTRIKEFIATITRRPSCMARVNWAEETSRFSYKRIRAIIVGLEDDTLCMKAKEYIVKAWCKQTGRNREEIEARLKSCLDERQEILRLKRYEETTNATPLLDENEYQRLKEENERLKQELAKYESDPGLIGQCLSHGAAGDHVPHLGLADGNMRVIPRMPLPRQG